MTEVNHPWTPSVQAPVPAAGMPRLRTDDGFAPAPRPQPLSPDCLAVVLDQLDCGAVLCDDQLRPLWLNEAARRELADGAVLHTGPAGLLEVSGGNPAASLRRAVHNAAHRGLRELVPLRTAKRLMMVGVQPLGRLSLAQPCALLLLGRRSASLGLTVQMLGQIYKLTTAEKDILTSLLSGQTVAEMAKARSVAISTVRTQVAAVRSKLQVRRIDDITRLVAQLPPMMSALCEPGWQ